MSQMTAVTSTCVNHVTQGAVRCHSTKLRAIFAGVVIIILVTSTTFTFMVKDPRYTCSFKLINTFEDCILLSWVSINSSFLLLQPRQSANTATK